MYSPEYKLAMRLAIAKARGWIPCTPRVFARFAPTHAFMKDGVYYGGLNSIPNYPENLNDMNEAEKSLLSDRDWDAYCDILGGSLRACASAPAVDRANALCHTLGLLN